MARTRFGWCRVLGVLVVAGLMSGLGCAAAGRSGKGMVVERIDGRSTVRLASLGDADLPEPPATDVESTSGEEAATDGQAARAAGDASNGQQQAEARSGEPSGDKGAGQVVPAVPEDDKRRDVEIDEGGEGGQSGTTGAALTRSSYTAPSAAVRNLSLATTVGAIGMTRDQSSAAEVAAESMILSAQGAVGQLGLTAPPTMVAGAVTSRSGLGRGPATGLGFAAMGNNLFSARVNRLSGVNGRCADLARAGFFGGDRHACERSFGR